MHQSTAKNWITRKWRFFHVVSVLISPLLVVLAGPVIRSLQAEEVVAEGVGTTSEDALKDAFRNSVRQVVGALVDAETLVKNDELIDDKVLTYSGGFIKTFEEVAGSKKVEGGLHRIKIKATVERLGVESKLKAANITLKKVDGQGLFAEVITQLDAEQSADAMLRKELEDFPHSLLTAQVVGKPELVSKTGDKAEVRFRVRVETDAQAYKAFADRLKPKLEKIATARGTYNPVLKIEKGHVWDREKDAMVEVDVLAPKDAGYADDIVPTWMPKAFEGPENFRSLRPGQVTLALTVQATKAHDRLECHYYLLDKSLQPLLTESAFRKVTAKLSLISNANDLVATDAFPVEAALWGNDKVSGNLLLPAGHINGNKEYFYLLDYEDSSREYAYVFWIGPTFAARNTNRLGFSSAITLSRTFSLSLEELQSVKEVRCEIVADE